MGAIRDYLLSVTAAALICGAVCSLAGKKGSVPALLKLLCGIFLAATVIKPAVDLRIDDFSLISNLLPVDADQVVENGKEMAAKEMNRIIKEKAEAYILDKAMSLGAEVEVMIELNDGVPVGITVKGDVSPFIKSKLSACITQDLGIEQEDQIWIRS